MLNDEIFNSLSSSLAPRHLHFVTGTVRCMEVYIKVS